jgi:Carboxypeptidase regulatory-like domain
MIRGVAAVAALCAVATACSDASPQRIALATATTRPARARKPDGPQSSGGYRVVPLTASGRIKGVVEFAGTAPADTVVHVTSDADVCGQTLVDVSVDHRGPRLASAVVWLKGITAGKHLPYVKRYDITTVGCRLVPRVQAGVVGGTLNVGNADQTTHRTVFIRQETGASLAAVQETEAGAVVPTAAVLSVPGLVEVRCDQHPWTRGWILVFDHPYFTTSDANGTFTIDSVPPGRYQITAWHERFGTTTDSVTVVAAQDAAAHLQFGK